MHIGFRLGYTAVTKVCVCVGWCVEGGRACSVRWMRAGPQCMCVCGCWRVDGRGVCVCVCVCMCMHVCECVSSEEE